MSCLPLLKCWTAAPFPALRASFWLLHSNKLVAIEAKLWSNLTVGQCDCRTNSTARIQPAVLCVVVKFWHLCSAEYLGKVVLMNIWCHCASSISMCLSATASRVERSGLSALSVNFVWVYLAHACSLNSHCPPGWYAKDRQAQTLDLGSSRFDTICSVYRCLFGVQSLMGHFKSQSWHHLCLVCKCWKKQFKRLAFSFLIADHKLMHAHLDCAGLAACVLLWAFSFWAMPPITLCANPHKAPCHQQTKLKWPRRHPDCSNWTNTSYQESKRLEKKGSKRQDGCLFLQQTNPEQSWLHAILLHFCTCFLACSKAGTIIRQKCDNTNAE